MQSVRPAAPPQKTEPSPAPKSAALIHFAGHWMPEDMRIVRRTVRHAERRRSDQLPSRSLGEPWVCTCQPIHSGRLYTAHRAGLLHTVTGRSARELMFRIHTFYIPEPTASPPPEAR